MQRRTVDVFLILHEFRNTLLPLPLPLCRSVTASPEPACAWQRCSRPHPDEPAYEVVFYHNSSTGVSQYEAPTEYLEWQVAHQAWQQQQQ
jgi:hypothetical protein